MKKNKLKKNFVIGSANFVQKYGASSTKVSYNEIKKILNIAKKNSIFKIDTAESYLKREQIFKDIDKKFKFTTKIIPDIRWESIEFCQKKIVDHFKFIGINKVETLFFHDIKILFTKNGNKIFRNFEELKKKKFFQKIGLSIYDINCLDYLILNYNFDVVQCPYNILDKRILTTGWYEKLKNQEKEIHIRSIFLQGMLVNKLLYKKKYFRQWKEIFNRWFKFLEDKKISPIDYCLSDLLKYDFNNVVVGIDNSKNLNELINFKTISKNKMKNFQINDTKLIDPRNWK